jgi:ankyrin repeat protein
MTALMWAAMNGHTEVVKALIENGADVNAKAAVRHRHSAIRGDIVSTGFAGEAANEQRVGLGPDTVCCEPKCATRSGPDGFDRHYWCYSPKISLTTLALSLTRGPTDISLAREMCHIFGPGWLTLGATARKYHCRLWHGL